MFAGVFMKELVYVSCEDKRPKKERRVQTSLCRCVDVKQKVCFSFHIKVDWNDGTRGWMRREEEGALQSCRLGCISSKYCSLPCGGHLTVVSPSTEGWLCLKTLDPWDCSFTLLGTVFNTYKGRILKIPREWGSTHGTGCGHNCPGFKPELDLLHKFIIYKIQQLSIGEQRTVIVNGSSLILVIA